MRRRTLPRGGSVTLELTEPEGFVTSRGIYKVSGTVSGDSPGTWEEPPDGGIIEIISVARIDPLTGEHLEIPEAGWEFTQKEYNYICAMLHEYARE